MERWPSIDLKKIRRKTRPEIGAHTALSETGHVSGSLHKAGFFLWIGDEENIFFKKIPKLINPSAYFLRSFVSENRAFPPWPTLIQKFSEEAFWGRSQSESESIWVAVDRNHIPSAFRRSRTPS